MSKRVSFVKFHQGLFIPNVGTLGDTLPSPGKTLKDLVMSLEADGYLSVTCGGTDVKTKLPISVTAYVPSTNIAVMTLAGNDN